MSGIHGKAELLESIEDDGVARRMLYLHPGQLFASAEPWSLTTILGSCVAVCLFDPAQRLGGVSHFILPMDVSAAQASPRFGRPAVDLLIEEMRRLGADPRRLFAKIFGGANVAQAFAGSEPLGEKNVQVARRRLADHAIPVVAHEVGGARARKLVYHTDHGAARVQML